MKKTYIKIILDEIKSSFGRFAAIFSIVTLSIGFLCGLLATTPDMTATADQYYDENNAADVNIKATMGLTKKDMNAVKSLAGVKEIMPAYVTDVLLNTSNSEVLNAKVFGLPLLKSNKLINNLQLVTGRMPESINECVVEKGWGSINDVELGSNLVISKENEDYENINDIYNVLEYKVVGIVDNPYYFSVESERSTIGNGTSNALVYVDESCYALDVHTDYFITVKGADKYKAFTDEYETYVEEFADKLEALEKEQSKIRLADIKNEAYEELSDAKKEYEEAKIKAETELNDAAVKIEDGKKELADARVELFDGKKEIEDAKKTLRKETLDAQKEIADGYEELKDAKIKLDDGEIKYVDGQKEIKEGQQEYDDGFKEFLEAEQDLKEGQKEFDDGEQKYLDGIKKLEEGKEELAQGSRELSSARNQLLQAEQELKQGQIQLNNQKTQFNVLTDQVIIALATSPSAIFFESESELFDAIQNDKTVNVAVTGILVYIKNVVGDPSLPDNAESFLYMRNSIIEAEQKLTYAEQQIAGGWEQYNRGRSKLNKGKKELREAEEELEDAKIEIEENRKKLTDGWAELEEARIELADAEKELKEGYKELEDARKELDDGWNEYHDGLNDLNEAEETLKNEIAKAEKEILDGEIELTKGQIDYEEGLAELQENEKKFLNAKEEAEEELNDAAEKIADAEKEIAKLENPQWYVLDRNSNVSYASFSANAGKVADVAKVFPIFFFLIAALVTLTTMTRMIEEERTQIGTLKALGYRKTTIILKYLIYSGLASTLGSIAGSLIGLSLFPRIIWNAYRTMYNLPNLTNQFLWQYALPESLLIILMSLGVTLYVSISSLKEKPSILMLPRAPKAGKRIFLENIDFIWARMKFTHKSTARNIMRYKRHLYMTIIGIAGCSALILTGFGLLDSIGSIANTQFTEIFKYNLNIELEDVDEYDDILNEFLEDSNKVNSYSEIYSESAYVHDGRERISTSLKVTKDAESLMKVISFRDRKSGNDVLFDESSVVMTEKLAETMEINIGDRFTLENEEGIKKEFVLTGITENYVGSYLYMNEDDYKNAFFENINYNTILVNASYENGSQEQYIRELLTSDSVMNVEPVTQVKRSFDNLLSTIEYIVVVIIIASGALAVIVLYNLTNININERRKELSTLKVLGYHNEEVAAYVFRETVILSLIGTCLGLPLGVSLHTFVIKTVEAVNLMMGRSISFKSYICSAAITLFFSMMVNLILYRKLRKIEMVESMKAID